MNELIQLISSLGFPIVACIFMYLQNTKTLNAVTQALKQLELAVAKLDQTLKIKTKGE